MLNTLLLPKAVGNIKSGLHTQHIHSLHTLFVVLLLLLVGGVDAFAWRGARVYVNSEPTNGGWVWVTKTNGNAPGSWDKTSDNSSQENLKISEQTFKFYLYANPRSGYTFKGWATSANTNTVTLTTQTNCEVSVKANKGASYNDYTYYAIFARLAASINSASFGNVTVNGTNTSTKTLTINHAHAGNVSVTVSGTNASDFTVSKSSFSSVSEGTESITVTFKPGCTGSRSAKITVSCDNGLSNQVINVSGVGVAQSQTLSWNNESAIITDMLVGSTQTVSASSTSGLAVTYTSSNPSVLTVNASGKLTAVAVGSATITVSQSGNCSFAAASAITKTFNVRPKDTPFFLPQGFAEGSSNAMKVGEQVTLQVQFVSDGLNGNFKAKSYDSNILAITRESNIITITALNAGTTSVTFEQTETSEIYGASKTYTFVVSKNANTLTVSPATLNMNMAETSGAISFSATNTETAIVVGASSDAAIATYDPATKKITTYHKEGTATFQVTQATNYKYLAPTAKTITVNVTKASEDCYVLDDAAERSWSTIDNSGNYSFSDAGVKLKFQAKCTDILGFWSTDYFYVESSADGSNWSRRLTINNIGKKDKWVDEECNIPEDARYVRFITTTGAIGEKHIRNVKVTRKNYLTATPTSLNFGDLQINHVSEAQTFTVAYSTCDAGNLHVESSNSKFVVSPSTINVTDNTSGTATISVTYQPNSEVGTDNGTITIYDRAKKTSVSVSGKAFPYLTPEYTCNIASTYYVEDATLDLQTLWTSTGDGTITYSITSFTPSSTINTGATAPALTSNRYLSLGQAGTLVLALNQATSDSYYGGSETKTITISKRPNVIKAVLGTDTTYTTSLPYNNSVTLELVADNESTPIQISQTSGNDLASYDATAGTITAGAATGTATWSVSQAENYKYVAATTQTITVYVEKPNHHVTVNYNELLFNDAQFTVAKDGRTGMANNTTLRLGGKNVIVDDVIFDDKYVVLHFDGIPDKLKFKHRVKERITILGVDYPCTNIEWFVQQSTENDFAEGQCVQDDPKNIWYSTSDAESNVAEEIQLRPDTRWVKICYSGNYWAFLEDLQITERTFLDDPNPTEWDFGTKSYGNHNNDTKEFIINWCNIAPVTITNSNPTYFNVDLTSFGGYDDYDSKKLNVTYKRYVGVGQHTATITISNETYTKTITVNGETTKSELAIEWHPDLVASDYTLTGGNSVYPDALLSYIARVALEDVEVTFSSDNSSIIEVSTDGKSLMAKAAGTCNITASVAESGVFKASSSTKEFTVSNQLRQSITWNDNLLNLLVGGSNVTLHATATSGGAITYTVQSGSSVSVSGNVLTILGVGEAYVTAAQAGGEIDGVEYAAISMTKRVFVRDPEAQCEDYALSGEACTVVENQDNPVVFDLDGSSAGLLTFDAYHDTRKSYWLQPVYYSALIIEQYAFIGNMWQWDRVFNTVTATSNTSYEATLDATATKIRVYTNDESNIYVSNIETKRRKAAEAEIAGEVVEAIDEEGVLINALFERVIDISMSNVDIMTASVTGDFSIDKTTVGEGCGWYGEDQIHLSFTPTEKTTYTGTLTLTDGKADPTILEVPITISTTALAQSIVDFTSEPITIYQTDEVTFHGRVVSGNDVYYTSSDESVAYVDGDNNLVVLQIGQTVVITAHCDAKGIYDAAPDVAKPITIAKPNPGLAWVGDTEFKLGEDILNHFTAECSAEITMTSSNETVAKIIDNEIHPVGLGEVTITSHVDETPEYAASSKSVQIIIIEPDLYIFSVEAKDTQWENADNWIPQMVPTNPEAKVKIMGHVVIDEAITVGGMIISDAGSVTVAAVGGLTVGKDGITGATASNFRLQSTTDNQSYFRLSPAATTPMPNATVELATKSTLSTGANKDATWQYFGVPCEQEFTVDGITWLSQWEETQMGWTSLKNAPQPVTLEPWAGYIITQYGEPTYEWQGQLQGGNHTINMTYTYDPADYDHGMWGDNVWANSFSAPIDISKITKDDFTKADGTSINPDMDLIFYLFNSGSWNQWQQHTEDEDVYHRCGAKTPGTYTAIPILSAKDVDETIDPITIAPMEGVYMWVGEDVQFHLNYEKHVWNATAEDLNKTQSAPARVNSNESDTLEQRLRLFVSSANSGSDYIYLFQREEYTPNFDNGYDAFKKKANGLVNLYTTEEDGQMAVSATNDIDSMYLGFVAGEDITYTIHATSIVGEPVYLKDMVTNTMTLMTEGASYTFTAVPSSTDNFRFRILKDHSNDSEDHGGSITTDIDENESSIHFWNNQHELYITDAPMNTTVSVYSISGQMIMSEHFNHSITISIDQLPKGIYVVNAGGANYKFVKE